MGLEIISNTSSTFVTIVGGKFTIRLPDGADDSKAVERVLEKGPNAGSTIKELQFNKLSGKISVVTWTHQTMVQILTYV